MDRITLQSPRQRGYGSTSSLRNDSLKHTRKHEKGREESNQEAKLPASGGPSGQARRTVRDGRADRPAGYHGLSGLSRGPSVKANRTTRTDPRKMDRPRRPGGLSARATDRPLLKLGPSANRLQRKPKTKLDQNEMNKNTKNARRTGSSRTVRRPLADRPRYTDRTENSPTSKVNSPKSSSDFPNGRSCRDKGLGA
jgi:hypothetical protein